MIKDAGNRRRAHSIPKTPHHRRGTQSQGAHELYHSGMFIGCNCMARKIRKLLVMNKSLWAILLYQEQNSGAFCYKTQRLHRGIIY